MRLLGPLEPSCLEVRVRRPRAHGPKMSWPGPAGSARAGNLPPYSPNQVAAVRKKGLPMRVPSSTQLKKRLHWPAYDPWTAHASARLIWGCWCRLRRSFSKTVQLSNLPPYSAFLEFFCRGPRGGPCGCRRSLAERSLKYPSYTNFRDRRPGAGLLIQTNRSWRL